MDQERVFSARKCRTVALLLFVSNIRVRLDNACLAMRETGHPAVLLDQPCVNPEPATQHPPEGLFRLVCTMPAPSLPLEE